MAFRLLRTWIIPALLLIAGVAFGGDPELDFKTGNQAYEQGRYDEAASRYRAAITNGGATFNAWFNLGNACFKAGELGRSIAAWRSAEALNPRDSGLRANLHFARKRAAGTEAAIPLRHTVLRSLTVPEWLWLACALIAAIFLLLAVYEWRRIKVPRAWFTVLLAAAFGVCAGALFSYRDAFLTRHAVVVAKESVLRLGPLEDSKLAFKLLDGAETEVLDAIPGWVQLQASDGRSGWARRDDVVILSPGAAENGGGTKP